ncbi:carboxylesterase family protein, partial [Belliella marina]
ITLPKGTTAKDGLPVMVWIHGGSYTSGAGDADVFDVKSLVEEQQVIVVNITYRLGLFGFLGGYLDRPANLGLLDMVAALRWIKTNIRSFGGNIDNITLFGQSAGADAIAHLMIAKDVDGLFHRVIIQSAPFGIGRNREKMTQAMKVHAAEIPDGISAGKVLEYQSKVSNAASKFGLKGAMPFALQYGHDPLPKEADIDEAWSRVATKYE